MRNRRIVALDLEHTGLSTVFNNIIELGVVEVVGGEIKTKYSRLFSGGRSPMYLVRKVHGIRDCDRKGVTSFAQACARMARWLEGCTLVTHNGIKFDVPFLEAKMNENGVSLRIAEHIDTYVLAKGIKRVKRDADGREIRDAKGRPVMESIFEGHSLEYLCGLYDIPYNEENHRGLKDCWCTLQLLYALCEKFDIGDL